MRDLQLLVGTAAVAAALALAACGDDESGGSSSTDGATGPTGVQEGCAPGYSPCLDADASDYDCDGGTGDGPKYTGRVEVTGSDPYDLDADGNGVGCE